MNRRAFLIIMILAATAAFILGGSPARAQQVPGGTPDYFNTPNWAYSPPLRKFVDTLPVLCTATTGTVNNLGQCLPVAQPDTSTYLGSDYYEIELGQYTERMHSDLPPTTLRGYRQTNTTDTRASQFHYLGPVIVATKDRPVRVKFTNALATGAAGNLFIPVDTSIMGAGAFEINYDPATKNPISLVTGTFTQNRATLHLHGGRSPWISDGTPHQWITPAGEATAYPKGVSVSYVPDMWFNAAGGTIASCAGSTECLVAGASNNPGPGSQTFYWSNQQSSRLMFYHDHAWGITRLNVYVGEAAGYLVTDQTEQELKTAGLIPADQIPLIIQDKTFVNAATIDATDPTWNWGPNPPARNTGDLWWPHVYMPAQNPYNPDMSGINPFGRWHYGPWFWPPTTNILYPPVPNPLYDPNCNPNVAVFCQPPEMPGTPNPSWGAEAFMDTPVVNGTAYPKLQLQPKAYRFRILNAAHDRFLNLQLYEADGSVPVPADCPTCSVKTEVKMVPAVTTPGFPANWPTDSREGGVPDPAMAGPAWIQIGTEGGFLPQPVVLEQQPITWNTDVTTFNAGNVNGGTLILGPAERADVIVDFSQYAGKTLILYNDAPAPFPALDPHYDYYTGAPNRTDMGGIAGTPVGRGPNVRTIVQIQVAASAPAPAYDLTALQSAFVSTPTYTSVFARGQDPVAVGQSAYNAAYNTTFPATWPNWGVSRISDNTLSFKLPDGTLVSNYPMYPKAIQDEMGETFDDYGRMSAKLGLELAFTGAGVQTFILQNYVDPATEIVKEGEVQIWKITHNGVDTHPVHFHLFEAQLLNRVGWDGFIRLPDPNELGWKDTIRISPLEDTVVALRPVAPSVPFALPNSVRPLNPSTPLGSPMGFTNLDPLTAQPLNPPVTNRLENFGWEYVWHCHILSHEESDMMRPIVITVPTAVPAAPTGLTATTAAANKINLTWTDNATDEISFKLERDSGTGFAPFVTLGSSATVTVTYTDSAVSSGATYTYRVSAYNTRGDSAPSNTAAISLASWSPATGATLSPNQPSPHNAGTAVLFTAGASGSTAVYQYRFWLHSAGTGTTLVQDYGTAAAWTMPASTGPGTYTITVDVRTDTTSPVPDVSTSVSNYVMQWPPALGVNVTPDKPSPGGAGNPVAFTALAYGSTGYEYQFSLSSDGGINWNTVQAWSSAATWTLPGTTVAGSYGVKTEARSNLTQVPVAATVNYTLINHSVSGSVRTSGGAVVAGVQMTLNSTPTVTVTTNASGAYSFAGVAPGSYIVTALLSGQTITSAVPGGDAVTVSGSNVAGVDFTLLTYNVSGTVTNGLSSVPGVQVALSTGATATTDVLGAYSFGDLRNATYTVTPGMAGQSFTPVNRTVTVNGANQTAPFTVDPHTVTPVVSGIGGTITPSTPQLISYNTTTTLTVTPDAGYHILSVTGCVVGNMGNVYTTSAIVSDCTVTASFAQNTFGITASAGPNGSVTPLGTKTVNYGASQTYAITPTAGYHVLDVAVDGVSAGAVTSYTFTNVTASHTIAASFAIDVFTITASAGASGSISPAGATAVTYGGAQTYSITPQTGYHVANVLVDGVSAGAVTSYMFLNVTANHTISASFAIDTFAVNFAAGPNGVITGTPGQTVSYGGSTTAVTAVPAAGYSFMNWTGTNGFVATSTNPLIVSNVTASHAIMANFTMNVFALNFSAGAGGSITGTASQTVNYGASSTAVTAVAAAGSHFVNWTGTNGFVATTANPLVVTNVMASQDVIANFAVDTFSVNFSAGANGFVLGTLSQTVSYLASASTVTAVPAANHHFVNWTGTNGFVTTPVNPLTVANVTASQNITANFTIDTFSVNFASGGNGVVTGSASQTIDYGGSATAVTAVPAAGYHFVNWTGTGGFVTTAANPLTVMNVTASQTITANFAIDTFGVNFTSGGNGTLTGTASQTINYGASTTAVTAVPSTGYHFVNWTGTGGFLATAANPLVVSNVTATMSITANFAIDTLAVTFLSGGNGTITGTASQTVNYGGSTAAVTAVPATGYHFVTWTGTGGFTSPANPLVVSNVTAAQTITANFAIDTFAVSFASGGNGTITGTASQTVNYGGSTASVTAVPATGYHFVSWTGTGGFAATNTNPLIVTNVTATHDITANFAIDTFAVSFASGGNGTITGTANQTVSYNGSASAVTAVPATGYHFVTWTGTGGFAATSTNPLTVTNVTAAQTITANFAIDTFAVSFASGGNGVVTGTASQTVSYGGSASAVTAVPAAGHHFVNWTGTGGFAGSTANPLLVSNVTGTMDITANFAIDTFGVNFASGGNGTLTGTAGQTINYGASTTAVTAVPSTGYHFVNWTGTAGFLATAANPLVVSNVTATLDITANFAIDTFGMNFISGGNGIVTGIAGQTVNYGASTTAVTAVPATGYHFVNWTGTNGFVTTTTNPLTVPNVTGSQTVTANFAVDIFSVNFASGGNGTLTGSANQTINYGASTAAVTAVPAANHHFVNWTGTGGFVTTTANPLIVTNVTATQDITANFAIDTFGVTFAAGANGSITGAAGQTVDYGASATAVTAVSAANHHFVNWTGTNGFVTTSVNPLTVLNVTASQAITANFAIDTFGVSFASGGNGVVTGSASQTIAYGGSATAVTAVPAAGYHFVNWTGTGGFSTSTENPLTVTSVTASQAITANFAIDTFAVNFTSGGNGTLTGSAGQTIEHGASTTAVTAVPATGHHFVNWTGTGGFITTAVNPLVVTNVTATRDITANFAINTYAVALSAGTGGSMNPSTAQSVNHGSTVSLTVTPDPGFHIVSVTGCGGTLTGNVFTTGAVTADCAVNAAFALPDGDLDGGGVSVSDALRALRIATGIMPASPADLTGGDVAPMVNGRPQPNGSIDIGDVIVILRKAVALVNW